MVNPLNKGLNKSLNKKTLRPILKQIRVSLSHFRREEASIALLEILLPTLTHARHILSFVSCAHEIDTSLINLYLARTGRLVLPKIAGETLNTFRVSNPHGHLITGSFGILEPNPKLCPKIDIGLLDIILVPALGFDPHNHRLGYGRGFYDRFLKQIPNKHTIGIGFKEQLISYIPSQAHDVPLEKVSLF